MIFDQSRLANEPIGTITIASLYVVLAVPAYVENSAKRKVQRLSQELTLFVLKHNVK